MARKELQELFDSLDDETRSRWQSFLEAVDAEIEKDGPGAVNEHLEAALQHLLAVGWALHRCYVQQEARQVLVPIGQAAAAVEDVRHALAELPKKPIWSQ